MIPSTLLMEVARARQAELLDQARRRRLLRELRPRKRRRRLRRGAPVPSETAVAPPARPRQRQDAAAGPR